MENIKELTFGVSFNHMFKLLDYWGEIADDILYNNKYFSPEFFSNISTQYTTERRLYNPNKKHLLVLTSNNLVFTQTIEDSYEKEYEMFCKRVAEYIVPCILTKYLIVVRRLGLVYSNALTPEGIQKFASQYFNPSVQNIIDFRFSKKEATVKGKLLTENSDYINKIYTVGNIGADIQGVSYDYQLHFYPLRQDVRDIINKFIKDADEGFKQDILACLGAENGSKK